MSNDIPNTSGEKKPRSSTSLSGIRVASDDEIRAAAKEEIARIRAEIAQQKTLETDISKQPQPTKRKSPQVPSQKSTSTRIPPTTSEKPPTSTTRITTKKSAVQVSTESDPEAKLPVEESVVAAKRTQGNSSFRSINTWIKKRSERTRSVTDYNIKRWEPTPEEALVLRAQKIRRLRVFVAISAGAFVGLLAIIIYLSTGGLVHPTQGVTTEWGTATQVNTLVDRFSTPVAGSHVIVHLPQNDTAEVLGFLQGFDGESYLVTIGENTITVPQSDYVGKVTAIWPDFLPGN